MFHHYVIKTAVPLLLAVTLAGCASFSGDLQDKVAREALALSPAVDDDEAVLRTGTGVIDGEYTFPEDLAVSDEAGLEDYVHLALERNPGILGAVRQIQVLGFRVPQVTSLDDPIISVLPPTGDLTETAAGAVDGGAGISQQFPFPGKLATRGRIAEQEVRMAFAALADKRIRTVAQVAAAYYDYYLAEISIQITRDSERLLRQIRDVASARYQAGAATQQDVLRAEVELYSLTNELITLNQQKATAKARLNALMDRPVDAALPAPKSFDLAAVDWKLPQALDRAAASNPQLVRLREQVKRDLEAVKLARLDYFPDLRLSFSYTLIGSGLSPVATGGDNWGLPFGLNLPIYWQRLRARVTEMNARTLASVEEFEDLRNLVFFGVQDTLVKIDTQYRQAVLFRDLIVPRAWQTVEVSTATYRAGKLEFTALIDNWKNWLDFSLSYYRALAQLEQRFADLQQLIGIRVPRSAEPPSEMSKPPSPTAVLSRQGGIHPAAFQQDAEAPHRKENTQ